MPDALDRWKWVFQNEENELRCGWRTAAFIAVFYFFLQLLQSVIVVLGQLFPPLGRQLIPVASEGATLHSTLSFLLNFGVSIVCVIIATALCASKLERRSFASVGYLRHPGFQRDFWLGSGIGALSIAVAVSLEVITGTASISRGHNGLGNVAKWFAIVFVLFLLAAAFEELFFRGFAFQALVHNLGAIPAIIIASAAFGALHVFNPGATLFSTANTVLAGIWLGIAYLKTRSLWLATGLHYAWNLAMVFFFGLPVSGISTFTRAGVAIGQSSPPDWISGGAYGPEGGICATIAIIISTLIIWKLPLFSASEQTLESIKHGKPEPTYLSILDQKSDTSHLENSSRENEKPPNE